MIDASAESDDDVRPRVVLRPGSDVLLTVRLDEHGEPLPGDSWPDPGAISSGCEVRRRSAGQFVIAVTMDADASYQDAVSAMERVVTAALENDTCFPTLVLVSGRDP